MVITVPVLFMMVVIAGFVPLLSIIIWVVVMPATFAYVFIHFLVYVPIFYFVSKFIAIKLSNIKENTTRNIAVSVLLASFLIMGLIPMYGVEHGTIRYENVYEYYGAFLN